MGSERAAGKFHQCLFAPAHAAAKAARQDDAEDALGCWRRVVHAALKHGRQAAGKPGKQLLEAPSEGYARAMQATDTTTFTFPVRLGILASAKSKQLGVGAEPVERLLSAWIGGPVLLGRCEDGSTLLTGAAGRHVSAADATGLTAIAMADVPVAVSVAWLAKGAVVRAAKDAERKLRTHGKPEGPLSAEAWPLFGVTAMHWRPWVPLETAPGSGGDLQLAMPAAALLVLAGRHLAAGAIASPLGDLAVAVAWQPVFA
jgi:hypothetical protein